MCMYVCLCMNVCVSDWMYVSMYVMFLFMCLVYSVRTDATIFSSNIHIEAKLRNKNTHTCKCVCVTDGLRSPLMPVTCPQFSAWVPSLRSWAKRGRPPCSVPVSFAVQLPIFVFVCQALSEALPLDNWSENVSERMWSYPFTIVPFSNGMALSSSTKTSSPGMMPVAFSFTLYW